MTETLLPGRTGWESAQYDADHGKTAATAVGFQLLARHINACAAEDTEIALRRGVRGPGQARRPRRLRP